MHGIAPLHKQRGPSQTTQRRNRYANENDNPYINKKSLINKMQIF